MGSLMGEIALEKRKRFDEVVARDMSLCQVFPIADLSENIYIEKAKKTKGKREKREKVLHFQLLFVTLQHRN